jgi:hypothetical protein
MAEQEPGTPDNGSTKPDGAEKKKGNDNRDLWRLLGQGIQLAVTVALFAALGRWVDSKYGLNWGTTVLGLCGIVIALYFFVKETSR